MEQHISRSNAPAAAFGGVELPVGDAEEVAKGKSQLARRAADCGGRAFELEDSPDGGLVQVDVEFQTGDAKRGAVFLIAKSGAEAQANETSPKRSGAFNGKLRLQPLLERGWRAFAARRRRSFRGHPSTGGTGRDVAGRSRGLSPQPKQTSASAKGGVWGIEQDVVFVDAPASAGSQNANLANDASKIGDAQLDLNFAMSPGRHT